MRLASLAVVASLLLAVGPSLADHRDFGVYEVTDDRSYEDWIEIEDDAYTKAHWGHGETDVDGGFAVSNVSALETEDRNDAHWLYVNDSDEDIVTSPVNVELTTEGAVVGAIDVFKVRDTPRSFTPDCPQYLVEEKYPDEDGSSWAFQVLHETTNFHQRSVPSQSAEVELNLQDAPLGYLVAIYPQAASGNENLETATGAANLSYEITFNDPDDSVLVENKQGWTAPDRPVETGRWIGEPGVGPTRDCADKGLGLPGDVGESQARELPGPGSTGERIASMLDASLE